MSDDDVTVCLSALEKVERRTSSATYKATVLPDFYLDRFIQIGSLEGVWEQMEEKGAKGGGSVRGLSQWERPGGNAVNAGLTLAALGLETTVITLAEGAGLSTLRGHETENLRLNVKRGRHGLTTIFEATQPRRANIMVTDPRDIEDIDRDFLSEEDVDLIRDSDAVGFFNWASLKNGSSLAQFSFSCASEGAITFLDPSDIAGRTSEFADFLTSSAQNGLISVLSLNRQEATLLSRELALNDSGTRDPAFLCRGLSTTLGVGVDIHTEEESVTSVDGDVERAQSFEVEPQTIAGAGDIWNAVDILGYLTELEPRERVCLANGAAAAFLAQPAQYPTLQGVRRWIEGLRG